MAYDAHGTARSIRRLQPQALLGASGTEVYYPVVVAREADGTYPQRRKVPSASLTLFSAIDTYATNREAIIASNELAEVYRRFSF